MATEDDDSYWNSSSAKGFNWNDSSDTVVLPSASISSSSSNTPATDEVSFEAGVSTSSRVAERVREATKMISSAAEMPEPSISQLVGLKDVRKLEAELLTVRKNFAKLQVDRFKPSSASQTIQDMVLGKPFSLEGFKSFQDKENLLDTALEWGDGDVVLAVAIMLKNTLKRSKFLAIMSSRQEAADQLISYLLVRLELREVVDLLVNLDRSHEAGVVAYKQAVNTNNLEIRCRNLKQTVSSNLRGHLDADLVLEQINLSERLAPVISSEVGEVDRQANSLVGASVLRTLLYLSTHHYGAAENFLHSPLALRKMHKLTDKQFTWVSLRARARMEAWADCEKLVVGKGWLGGKKAIGSVSPGEVVTVLSTAGAPGETLAVILGLVDNMEEKLMLAKKVGVASVVVDVLVTQKDRLAIISYQATLPANSRDWFYADNALRNSVKWKN